MLKKIHPPLALAAWRGKKSPYPALADPWSSARSSRSVRYSGRDAADVTRVNGSRSPNRISVPTASYIRYLAVSISMTGIGSSVTTNYATGNKSVNL